MWIDGVIVTYGLLCVLLFTLRVGLAHVHHLRHKCAISRSERCNISDASVSVIYPIYNESPEVLRLVINRIRRCFVLPGIEFILVDDGSPNRSELEPIYRECERYPQIHVLYQNNRGKREAQHAGLAIATGEYIVTVDSDTLIDPDGIQRLIAPLQRDDRIGAVCGEVAVENASANFLTRMIAVRYWTSFNVERAAQSVFRSVLCCSGPFSAYRASLLHSIKDKYIEQMFCGQRCTYGDDRHLTNLVLAEDYRVVYQPDAVAWTFTPETLSEYIRQQTRWNKSFYREILWTMKIADRVHPYALLDMLLQPILFLAFTLSLSHGIYLLWATEAPVLVVYYLAIVVTMASARSLYGLVRTWDPRFLLLVIYGFLHVFVLIPVRFKSILTLTDNRWGTRMTRRVNTYRNFSAWAVCYASILVANVVLLTLLDPYSVVPVFSRGVGLSGDAMSSWISNLIVPMAVVFAVLLGLITLIRFLSRRSRLRTGDNALVKPCCPVEK